MDSRQLIDDYYGLGLSSLSSDLLRSQRMMNGLLVAILDNDYYLWQARRRRAEARLDWWLRFDEHEPTLCRGEMR